MPRPLNVSGSTISTLEVQYQTKRPAFRLIYVKDVLLFLVCKLRFLGFLGLVKQTATAQSYKLLETANLLKSPKHQGGGQLGGLWVSCANKFGINAIHFHPIQSYPGVSRSDSHRSACIEQEASQAKRAEVGAGCWSSGWGSPSEVVVWSVKTAGSSHQNCDSGRWAPTVGPRNTMLAAGGSPCSPPSA